MNIYVCPMCKQDNAEHQSYCLNCGTWLVDAKKKEKNAALKKGLSTTFSTLIIALIIIGAVSYFNGNTPMASTTVFEDMTIHQFTISQMKISRKTVSSVPIEFTSHKQFDRPIEISAIYFDRNETRISKASTIVYNKMTEGQTITLDLKFDTPTNLKHAQSVRVQIRPLSPFDILQ